MKSFLPTILPTLCFTLFSTISAVSFADIEKGKTYQTLVNLHTDPNKKLAYTMNYQLTGGLIPVCSDIKIKKVKKKYIQFDYKGVEYLYKWDGHTRKAGKSTQDVAALFFGEKCDEKKIKSLSKTDQDGIRKGEPLLGMTRQGVLFAMGRPPFHVNADLEASSWMYWINRFNRVQIHFNEKGIVEEIKN